MPDRTFAIASDEALIELIRRARDRLVIIAPALTNAVAEAITCRFDDLGSLSMTVILDSDPEVYRLGFGDQEALETIRKASVPAMFDLREQQGVRIGVIISDDTTMVYSPVCKNIEAGSISVEKPNAIVLRGHGADAIASAAGAATGENVSEPEVGKYALDPATVESMQENLKANPPKSFDIARKLNVFTSKVRYVDFSAPGSQLTKRQIPLPDELSDVTNDNLKKLISSRIRAPLDQIGKLEIIVETDGKSETVEVDDAWINKERKRIADEYTYPIKNYGSVIFYNHQDAFEKATARLQTILDKYHDAVRTALKKSKEDFEKQLIEEFRSRWQQNPPKQITKWGIAPGSDQYEAELGRFANKIFEKTVSFDKADVEVRYKNIAPENLADSAFLDELKKVMEKKGVPREIINSLFEQGEAAPQTDAFLGRRGR